MNRRIYIAATILTVLSVSALFLELSLGQKHEYLSVSNDDGMTAEIYWQREFPYVGVSAYLNATDREGRVLLSVPLMLNRDHENDIKIEIRGLYWTDSGNVRLDLNRNHYKGPEEIKVPM